AEARRPARRSADRQRAAENGEALAPFARARNDPRPGRVHCGVGVRREGLAVLGRTLTVRRTARGAARFGFDELCAQPLGPSDYLAIARHYATVFIDAIPIMGPEKRNEAKRFVTLIDALYDTRTKLVCSAAGEPDDLYHAGDGAFEFERTASRLIEMRSADYLRAAREPGAPPR
ncbi:MAG: AFG1/ZapE family ATPase, partial [Pseudomonadota bacterium]